MQMSEIRYGVRLPDGSWFHNSAGNMAFTASMALLIAGYNGYEERRLRWCAADKTWHDYEQDGCAAYPPLVTDRCLHIGYREQPDIPRFGATDYAEDWS